MAENTTAASNKRRRLMTGSSDDNNDDSGQHFPEESIHVRTTALAEPTLRLTGHSGSVYCLGFDPSGNSLASGSFDRTILLWDASGCCHNYNVLEGHKNAVLDLRFGDGELVSASADKTLGLWDPHTAVRIKKFSANGLGIVNAVDTSSHVRSVLVSASDDGTARLFDSRISRGGQAGQLKHDFPVTSVAFAGLENQVFTGGIDNWIHCWDIRQSAKVYSMKGHGDSITYLSLHPKGTHLLSNSMDGTLRTWDVRPFVETGNRHRKTFYGGTHGADKALLKCAWSSDGSMVSCGSSDRNVHIWDEPTEEELYLLPGHGGTVHTTIFHPTSRQLIASSSSDKTIYVGELG